MTIETTGSTALPGITLMSMSTSIIDRSNTSSAGNDTEYAIKDLTLGNIDTWTLSSVPGDGENRSSDHPLAWCHDLQGSDFIYSPTLYSAATRHIIAVAFILLIVITVMGNAFVIITVVADKPLKKITRALVVSMAASDILVALCGELQSVVTMLTKDAWVLSDILCEVFTSADLYFSLSGILHIVCLAGDRYLAICYPFKYERMDHKFLVVSVVSAWTVPLLFSFVPILAEWHRIGLDELYACLQGLEVHVCTMIPNKGFSTITFIIMFAVPSLVMGFCYAQIYRTAMSHKERISTVTLGSYSSEKSAQLSHGLTSSEDVEAVQGLVTQTYADVSSSGDKSQIELKEFFHCGSEAHGDAKQRMETCLSKPSASESSSGVDSLQETIPLHHIITKSSENRHLEKNRKRIASCPNLAIAKTDNHFSPVQQQWSSLCQISSSNVRPCSLRYAPPGKCNFTPTDSNVKTPSISSPTNCYVMFSLDSPLHKDIQIDSNYLKCPLKETNGISSSGNTPKKTVKSEVIFKPWRRSFAEDGSVPPHIALRNEKFLAQVDKKRHKKKSAYLKSHKHGFLGEDFRTARSISLIIVCFAVTWCPYWVTMLIMPYLGPGAVPDPLIGACLWLAYVGSAVNPFVYYFSNSSVKKGIKRRFMRALQSHRQLL